ncbi:MAG TPA: nickel-responsive transcriptional regulator NikR [Candidatus Sumerlaeota bacterium]|nr:MAG: putative nickel-responsive regulator [candidate division BRC1 bacterium ADurb.BinA292]HOE95521.1 nickel-responsive transcriptional regulator NikR [Candidatus Sumerlaeota bacterium]HOR29456.1 nickel-responsive transcriptional regulator NikR [Candidatus Sumerlaeota bacterium]
MSELERYTVTMPHELLEAFDSRNERKGYRNRSEAIRDLVRDALIREQWTEPNCRAAATLTLIYDHHTRAIGDRITELQHDFGELVVSTLHVHLDHHNCLEVLVMRGMSEEIRRLADAIGCIKGVKHAQLTLTAEGRDLH